MNLPAGYELDGEAAAAPTPPPGYTLDAPPPAQSPVESAARGALRNFPAAQQLAAAAAPINPLSDKPTYSDELQHLTEAAEAGKAQNPKSYYTGATLGAVAPAFVPGIGEALEAAPVLGGAALGAGQATSDTSATKNPGQFAGEAALGAGTGAAVGKAGQWLGKLLPTADELTAGATAKKLGIPARRVANILGSDPQGGLGEIADTLQSTVLPDGSPLLKWSDNPLRFAKGVEQAVDSYGKQIGQVVKSIDTEVAAKPLTQDISSMAVSDSGLAVRNQFLDSINQIISENADKEGNLSFGKLRDLTNHIYKEMVVEDPQTGRLMPGSEKALQAWKYLRSLQNAIVEKSNPEMFGQFMEASHHYSNLVGLQKALNASALKAEVKPSGLLGNLNPLSAASNLGKTLGAATGLDRVLTNAPIMLTPALRGARGALPKKIPQAAATDLADFLEKKFGKK